MSTATERGGAHGLLARARRAAGLAGRMRADPVAAGGVALGAVAALALAGPAPRTLAAGVLLALLVVGGTWAAAQAWRRRAVVGPALVLLAVLAGVAFAIGDQDPAGGWVRLLRDPDHAPRVVALVTALLLGASGPVLLVGACHALLGARRAASDTPWRSLVGRAAPDDGAVRRAARRVLLAGAIVVAGVGVGAVRSATSPNARFTDVLPLTVLTLLVLLGGPVAVAVAVAGRTDRREREAAVHRQAVAAHLHDSVLQTFALIQRNLQDPKRVGRLVRTQERELRDWLAGRDPDVGGTTLGGALRAVADGVEEEQGVVVELDVLDDPPYQDAQRPLLEASREALRNAARHGGPTIRVLAEVRTGADAAVVVYVRDDGAGFATGDVDPARRGIADAIVGRMTAAGGTARVDSAPGEGTEVVLELPQDRRRPRG